MIIRDDKPSSDVEGSPWAFEAIGMPSCASTVSLRRAFLARLAAASFVPDEYGEDDREKDEEEDDDDVEVFPEADVEVAAESELNWTEEEVAETEAASSVSSDAEVDFPIDADAARPITVREAAAFEQLFVARGVLPNVSALASGVVAELGVQSRLRQVESFVAVYFDLEPRERRAQWEELAAACRGLPRVRARLARLERGLDVSLAAARQGPIRARTLGEVVAALFLLPPAVRGAYAARFFVEHLPAAESWSEAARQLTHLAPEVAALEPSFVSDVVGWVWEPPLAKMTAAPIVVGDEWMCPRWLASCGNFFSTYAIVGLMLAPIVAVIIAALTTPNDRAKSKRAAPVVDSFKLEAEKVFVEMEAIVLKPVEDLTPRDKHLLKFYGFLNADEKLDGNQRMCLMFYSLHEMRKVFRKHRSELIEQLNSSPPAKIRRRVEPAPQR